jgi:hypothetical protein
MTPQSENWRVLVVNRDGTEILLKQGDTGFELPRIKIPTAQRIAAGIVSGAEEELGLRVIGLYQVFPQNHAVGCGDYYHAAVAQSAFPDAPGGMVWTPIRSAIAESFLQGQDAVAIKALWSQWQAEANNCRSEPFSRPGWFSEVTDWIARSLASHSLFLTGSFRQLNASSTFSLIQFDTNRRPVWFKAVGEPNTREFAVTLALAKICPDYLPKIIAGEPAWRAWLTEEAAGTSLAAANCATPWQSAAEGLALLQLLAQSRKHQLCEAAARDLRSRQLLELVPKFFEWIQTSQLANDRPLNDEFQTTDLSTLQDTVTDTLMALEELDIPDTIGHMDLNPQNIFCSESGSIFLDWAESFIGCPLFSFEYLLQHFRRTQFADPLSEAELRNVYYESWRDVLPPRRVRAGMQLIPLAALFSYAVTLSSGISSHSLPPPAQRRYFLRLLRKMKRMASPGMEVCA